ncbi:apolipoprotein A-I-like [Pygocentrus nattereri]|uniref:apolipoprotein A-I-like n=1 Tax=Pygocentrus nattereri TaxID=42514 RepID=UPI001891E745|nr:apolipoprotein A-I-like [Pygocentrus nattereri]
MKVVVLALTLLLALGSHAHTLQADASSQQENYKAAAMVYLDQVKAHVSKALEHLEGTEYDQYKQKVTESLDKLQQYAETTSRSLSPYTTHLMDSANQMHEHILSELENLHSKLVPIANEYKEHVLKAVEDVKEKLAFHTAELHGHVEPFLKARKCQFISYYVYLAHAIDDMLSRYI